MELVIEINNFLKDLIGKGCTDITKLTKNDKEKLTALIILSKSKSAAVQYITETPKTFEYSNLLAYFLLNNKKDQLNNLIETIIEGAIEKCTDDIIVKLKDAVDIYKLENK